MPDDVSAFDCRFKGRDAGAIRAMYIGRELRAVYIDFGARTVPVEADEPAVSEPLI